MPRKPRLQVAGLPVHIIQRGNNRQPCFFAENDFRFFLDHLGKLAKRFHCSLHAYVLMTKHFHLLLRYLPNGPSLLISSSGSATCSMCLQAHWLLVAGAISLKPGTDAALLGCYRYIEMNPVRANSG